MEWGWRQPKGHDHYHVRLLLFLVLILFCYISLRSRLSSFFSLSPPPNSHRQLEVMSRPHAPSRQSNSSSLLGSPIAISKSSSSSSLSSSFGQRLIGKLRRTSKYNHKQLRCDEWDWTCQGDPELSEAGTPEITYDVSHAPFHARDSS